MNGMPSLPPALMPALGPAESGEGLDATSSGLVPPGPATVNSRVGRPADPNIIEVVVVDTPSGRREAAGQGKNFGTAPPDLAWVRMLGPISLFSVCASLLAVP